MRLNPQISNWPGSQPHWVCPDGCIYIWGRNFLRKRLDIFSYTFVWLAHWALTDRLRPLQAKLVPPTESSEEVRETHLLDGVSPKKCMICRDGNRAREHMCLLNNFPFAEVNRRKHEITKGLKGQKKKFAHQASAAGTQALDNSWNL